jgi:hypothetical protein
MKVDAEDFRRVYDAMNDEALLAVDRDELVDVAQQCYDAELVKRGLVTEEEVEETTVVTEVTEERQEMVELATFTDVDDARMALALLKTAEIPCWLENAASSAIGYIGNPAFGEFRLSVPPAYLEQAQEVLETEISEEELAAQAEAAGIEEEELEEELEAEEEERE